MRPNSLQFYTYSLVLLLTCIRSSAVATDLQTDVNNCGRINHVCYSHNGKPSCEGGVCRVECNDGFVLKNGICVESKSHKKERMRKPLSLCPAGETACPIQGSKSFESFEHSDHQVLEFLTAKGGYECLDVSTDLESCGGCTSLGQGRNCNDIPHAMGVGCSVGQCIIFSCEAGYTLSLDGGECQRKRRPTHLGGHHARLGHARAS